MLEVELASKNAKTFRRVNREYPQSIISKNDLLSYLNKHNILFLAEENLTTNLVKDIENQHKEQMRQKLNRQIFS